MVNPGRNLATWALLGLMVFPSAQAETTFATIDDDVISIDDFERFVYAESRRTFYHGSPLDEQGLIDFRRQAANDLIDRHLKIREARQRGLQADQAAIDGQLADYEARYGETERWQTDAEAMEAAIRAWLEDESLLAQIDADLRDVADPDEDQLRSFYNENLDRFTQPEQLHVSVILLRVPPSSGPEVWDQAIAEAESIAARIAGGAEFADEARRHSDDPTAAKGGDMGYVHAGTLGPDIQTALDALQPGEFTRQAVRVLEGAALVLLRDRRPAALVPFADIRDQVLSLYRREAGDAAYASALDSLRERSEIWIDERVLQQVAR